MAMWLICIKIILSLWAKHRYEERKEHKGLHCMFDEYSKSKPLTFADQSLGHVYDDLACGEDFYIHC